MLSPNWEAFEQAIGIMLVATPFMFGVLTLFALVTMWLSYVKSPKKGA